MICEEAEASYELFTFKSRFDTSRFEDVFFEVLVSLDDRRMTFGIFWTGRVLVQELHTRASHQNIPQE